MTETKKLAPKKEEVVPKEPTLEQIKKMNIYEKMSYIEDGVGVVAKNLNVAISKTASYKAVSEADVKKSVSPLEHKFRVKSIPVDIEIVDSGDIVSKRAYGEITEMWMRVRSTVRFVNIDNPDEFVEVSAYGDGIDSGDKAPGKGDTYSVKYCYLKAYKIVTGDDPDKDPSPEDGGKVKKATTNPKWKKADNRPAPSQTSGNKHPKPPRVPEPSQKPKLTPTTDTKVEGATPQQKKLIGVYVNKGSISNEVKLEKLDKTTASKLIDSAKKIKEGSQCTVRDGQVVEEEALF